MDKKEMYSVLVDFHEQVVAPYIQGELKPIKKDIQVMKEDMQVMKEDMQVMKEDMQVLDKKLDIVAERMTETRTNHEMRLRKVESELEVKAKRLVN